MRLEDLGLIGNCQYLCTDRLRDGRRRRGAACRASTPSPSSRRCSTSDGGRPLHDRAGRRAPGHAALPRQHQRARDALSRPPTARFRVLDFAPRFLQHERIFRPTKLVRIVEPLEGTPRVRVHCDPLLGWSKGVPTARAGLEPRRLSMAFARQLRLTTDVPLSYLDGRPFALTERQHLVLDLGRAGRGAAAAAVRALPARDRLATGSAG